MTNPAPGRLVWAEVPDPQPGEGEVLIQVAASAVNRADLLQVAGNYPAPPGASPYPGLECSGFVSNSEVSNSEVSNSEGEARAGEPVCALLAGGGYAEKVSVPREHLLPVPRGVSVEDAAALPEVACTVWSNLTMVAHLKSGETVLIHGGGSGIGTFAIQYAKALGAKVITTARAAKHDKLRELGADEVLDYTTDDFSHARADVVLDIMGASYLERNLQALATGGRLVIIGLQGGRKAELDLGALLTKRALVAGTTLRSRPNHEKSSIIQGVLNDVWPRIEKGEIRPVIDRRLPLSEAARAHALVAANEHVGKVLLVAS